MTAHSTPAALPHRAYAGLVSRLAALAIDVTLLALAAAATRLLPPAIWQEIFGRPAPGWLEAICGFAGPVDKPAATEVQDHGATSQIGD